MLNKNVVTQMKVAAGRRTYFLEVHKTGNSNYLKVSELKLMGNGNYERHNILVFEEDIQEFAEALNQLLTNFSNTRPTIGRRSVRQRA